MSQGNGHGHRPAHFLHGFQQSGKGQWEQSDPRVPSPLGVTLHVLLSSFPSKEAELWQCPSFKGKESNLVGSTGCRLSFPPPLISTRSFPPPPPRAAPASQFSLGFLRVREEHASEGEQPLAFVVFFRVTQEVADGSTHHARPRAPTPPPPIVPVGHLPAVSQGRGRADGVGTAQAGGHGRFEGERLLLAAVRGVGVFVQGQVGLGDVALRGGVAVRGPGRLRQAGVVALQSLGGQRGAALASIRRRRDASRVSNQGAVGQEGPRLRRDGWELPTTSSWGAGVRDGGDGALTQGACALYRGETWQVRLGLARSLPGTLLWPLTVLQEALEKGSRLESHPRRDAGSTGD